MDKKPSEELREVATLYAIRACVGWLMSAEFRRNGADPEKAAAEWMARAERMARTVTFPGIDAAYADATSQEWFEAVERLVGTALGRPLGPKRPPASGQ